MPVVQMRAGAIVDTEQIALKASWGKTSVVEESSLPYSLSLRVALCCHNWCELLDGD